MKQIENIKCLCYNGSMPTDDIKAWSLETLEQWHRAISAEIEERKKTLRKERLCLLKEDPEAIKNFIREFAKRSVNIPRVEEWEEYRAALVGVYHHAGSHHRDELERFISRAMWLSSSDGHDLFPDEEGSALFDRYVERVEEILAKF